MILSLLTALSIFGVSAHSGETIVIGGKNGWTTGVEYDTVVAKVNDRLVFNFFQNHDVYQLLTEECNFEASNAQLLAANFASPYTHFLTEPGTLYFSCSTRGHCARGQRVKVVVEADVHPEGEGERDNATPAPDLTAEEKEQQEKNRNVVLARPRMLHAFEKTHSSVTLIWMAPDNGTCDTKHSYKVMYKKGNKKAKRKFTELKRKVTDPTAIISDLLPDTLYTFKVVAINGAGKASKPALFVSKTGTAPVQ